MRSNKNTIRDLFCILSGEDKSIIGMCDIKIKNRFTQIGVFVFLIFIGCLLNSYLFASNMFHDDLVGVALSFVVALMFTNLYLLILYTISPPLLPEKKIVITPSGKKKYVNHDSEINTRHFGFSFYLRIVFLMLIALFIVQPTNVLLFSDAPDYGHYAQEIRNVLNQDKRTWLTNLLACLIFVFPVYLKYAIRNTTDFYKTKQQVERNLVERHYDAFLKQYIAILSQKINEYQKKIELNLHPYLDKLKQINPERHDTILNEIKTEFSSYQIRKDEKWVNPPFRTKEKDDQIYYFSESDFLNTIYPELPEDQ